jgi:hypothetical protein
MTESMGHDHDYERSYLVRGTDSGTALRPHVVSTDLSSVNSDEGLVHLVIGTGGTKGHDDVYQTGTAGGPTETINVSGTATETDTYYQTQAATASNPYPAPVEFDTVTATRTRSGGFGFRKRGAK